MREQTKDWLKSVIETYFIIVVTVLLVWMLCGCSTTKYVPVTETKEVYINKTDTVEKVDSFIERTTTVIREVDSTMMAEYGIRLQGLQKAWLIEKNSLEQQLRIQKEIKADTIIERDSIPVVCTVTKNELTTWQKIQVETWWSLIIVIVLLLVFLKKKG